MYLEKNKKKPTMKQIWFESQREPENYQSIKSFSFTTWIYGVEIEGYHKEKEANFKHPVL